MFKDAKNVLHTQVLTKPWVKFISTTLTSSRDVSSNSEYLKCVLLVELSKDNGAKLSLETSEISTTKKAAINIASDKMIREAKENGFDTFKVRLGCEIIN